MKKILVIEDNEQNLYLIRFILQKNGYKVLEARTGEAGVEAAAAEKPDLILMDIQLPDIDGYEATKRIKCASESCTAPIIAITSYAMTGDREKSLAAGCSGYIEKPINPETVMDEISAYI
ncbi:MAG TPA: response regulator [bacterium]|nr:response regulator [bacterium]